MKWIKVNSNRHVSEDGKYTIRKMYSYSGGTVLIFEDVIEGVAENGKEIKKHMLFDSVREAKKYIELM